MTPRNGRKSRGYGVGLVNLLAVGLPFLAGCEGQEGCGKAPVEVGSSENASQDESLEGAMWLEHDFGVLKPRETREHTFAVENRSSQPWTVRKIVNTCSCTVAHLSAPAILPGKTENVSLVYQAGKVSIDHETKALVLFAEETAPPIVLGVRAKVREAMTVVPRELSFRQLARGGSRQSSFEIQNFGDRDWGSIAVETSANWLSVSCSPLEANETTDPPRQSWRVTVTADATGLPSGQHDATIVAKGDDSNLQEISVQASVTSPVNAIPAQFFFGRVPIGQRVSGRMTFRFAPDAVPASAEGIVIEHDFGDQLEFEWLKTEGEFWELAATFSPRGPMLNSKKKVSVSFSDPKMPRLELPVFALVSE